MRWSVRHGFSAVFCLVLAVAEDTLLPGDLLFVHPDLNVEDDFARAIAATGAATVQWLAQQGFAASGNETATHVALVGHSGRDVIQAVPLRGVVRTPLAEFVAELPPGALLLRGRLRPSVGVSAAAMAAAVDAALGELGRPYADTFAAPRPGGAFYCSSLVAFAYGRATGRPACGPPHGVFLPAAFRLIFEPRAFWRDYYAKQGYDLDRFANTTGSNPTLLLHSPAVSFQRWLPPSDLRHVHV